MAPLRASSLFRVNVCEQLGRVAGINDAVIGGSLLQQLHTRWIRGIYDSVSAQFFSGVKPILMLSRSGDIGAVRPRCLSRKLTDGPQTLPPTHSGQAQKRRRLTCRTQMPATPKRAQNSCSTSSGSLTQRAPEEGAAPTSKTCHPAWVALRKTMSPSENAFT